LGELVKESTNQPDFLKRTAIVALVSGVVAGLFLAMYRDWAAGSGFVLAVLWSLGNIAVLAGILRTATNPVGLRKRKLVGLIALKLIGFYGVAIWVLIHRWFPLGVFAAGMGWPLLIGAFRALTPSPLPSRRPRVTP
jgi:hypothetical protein